MRRLSLVLVAATVAALLPAAAAAQDDYQRLAGSDRIETAIAASGLWEASASVVIAISSDFPDALAAGALAADLEAPLLLTPGDALDARVAEEVARLGADAAYVVGGEAVLSPDVVIELEGQGLTVERVSGEDRYGTAAEVARLAAAPSGEAVVAVGDDFPDAVSGGALSASPDRLPVLLTRPEQVPDETVSVLTELDVTSAFVLGGEAVIDRDVDTQLQDTVDSVSRLAGANRYATSVDAAGEAMARFDGEVPVVFATGMAFPDALAGTAVAAELGGLLVLTPGDRADSTVEQFILRESDRISDVYVLGGTAAIGDETAERLAAAASGDDPADDSVTLTGSGQQLTEAFTVDDGLTIATSTHRGDRNFIVWALDEQGERQDLLVNAIGDYDGATVADLDAGTYRLDVSADGNWTVNIALTEHTGGLGLPTVFEGDQDAATEAFATDGGLISFTYEHSGESNFIAWLWTAEGTREALIANEIGETSGSTGQGLDAGLYVLEVAADGDWSITVE